MDQYPTTTDLRALPLIEQRALALAAGGAERISIKTLIEYVRAETKLTINNSESSFIVDELVARNPHLEPLIERRARGRRGPNKPAPMPPNLLSLPEVKALCRRAYQLGLRHGAERAALSTNS